ncbi:MAG: hypothetical protein B7Z66_13915 [Chromatiales bacterium 21-64-14]|nr:MAG: hypothetical protein B7Z66_13915 [Chromatiales bacterium 21-64-14]
MKPFYVALIPVLLVGCAVANNGVSGQTQTTERERQAWVYNREINQIVAHSIRRVRIAEERLAMKKAGHPVPLKTGWCGAAVSINDDGSIKRINMTGCASHSLGEDEQKAIKSAAPFPPPGNPFIAVVHTYAPIATPGVNGN